MIDLENLGLNVVKPSEYVDIRYSIESRRYVSEGECIPLKKFERPVVYSRFVDESKLKDVVRDCLKELFKHIQPGVKYYHLHLPHVSTAVAVNVEHEGIPIRLVVSWDAMNAQYLLMMDTFGYDHRTVGQDGKRDDTDTFTIG